MPVDRRIFVERVFAVEPDSLAFFLADKRPGHGAVDRHCMACAAIDRQGAMGNGEMDIRS